MENLKNDEIPLPTKEERFENEFLRGTSLPKCKYISSTTGQTVDSLPVTYLGYHLRNRTELKKAIETSMSLGAKTYLEVSAHPVLHYFVSLVLGENGYTDDGSIQYLPTQTKKSDQFSVIFETLGQLYVLGVNPDWCNIFKHEDVHKIKLPWISAKMISKCSNPTKSVHNTTSDESAFLSTISHLPNAGKKEAVEKLLLGIIGTVIEDEDELTVDALFQEMGLDSSAFMMLKSKIEKALGDKSIKVGFNDILENNNVRRLASRILEIYDTRGQETEMDLEAFEKLLLADMELWPEIKALKVSPPTGNWSDSSVFLVTGATGNLAPYILEVLTKRSKVKKVYCLLRRNKRLSCTERLTAHLKKVNLLENIDMSKVECVEGDISKENLGMSPDAFDKLVQSVEAVINCAVYSNHVAEYKVLPEGSGGIREINVLGTQRVIKFCLQSKTKYLYHASSMLGVGHIHDQESMYLVDDFSGYQDILLTPRFGYGVSKNLSDNIVRNAIAIGLPAKVFNYPKINGDTYTGQQDVLANHFFMKFLYFIIAGTMPDLDVPLQLLPVDTCAVVSIEAFLKDEAPTGYYFVANPHYCLESELGQFCEEFGPQLRILKEIGAKVTELGEEGAVEYLRQKFPFLAKYGMDVLNKPQVVFGDENIRSFLKSEFGYAMKEVPYKDFVQKVKEDGEGSLIYSWLEFYTKPDNIYALASEEKLPVYRIWQRNKEEYFSTMKMIKYLPNYYELVEHPMDTVRRDLEYTIAHGKEIFLRKNFNFLE